MTDRFDSYPGGVAAWDQEVARQAEMRTLVEKLCRQYLRGLITAEELASETLQVTDEFTA